MSPESSFADLMARLRAGDATAAAQFFERFAHRLVALAQGHLDGLTRRLVDPEDVLQSVLRSFFVRHAGGQFELADWDGLWAMLVVMTLRKCGRQVHRFRAARRDVRREVTLPVGRDELVEWEALADGPTPAEAATLCDLIEQLRRSSGPDDWPVVALCLQGHTHLEVANQVGCTERTVRRVAARTRQRLQRLCGENPD
jgi:RNA polymerase sigma-70 factor (ECF subfamily)